MFIFLLMYESHKENWKNLSPSKSSIINSWEPESHKENWKATPPAGVVLDQNKKNLIKRIERLVQAVSDAIRAMPENLIKRIESRKRSNQY